MNSEINPGKLERDIIILEYEHKVLSLKKENIRLQSQINNISHGDKQSITLERAVEILNETNHRGQNQWKEARYGEVHGLGVIDMLFYFEVIAIAEKYEKEGKS